MSELRNNTGIPPRSFVPRLLSNYITSRVLGGKESLKAKSFFFRGVCLIVDISGFTALSGSFCDAGKKGIDGLQVCTNGYIGQLVAIVHAHGGDIVKFAGDALVCVFAEEKFSTCSISEKKADIPLNVLIRAMMCAKEVRSVRTDRLTVHVGMSCGEMCFGILGGVENRWECLISGPCIHELSDCLDDAPSMQAVMTHTCWEILRDHQTLNQASTTEKLTEVNALSIMGPEGPYDVQMLILPSGNVRIVDISFDPVNLKQPSFLAGPATPAPRPSRHQQTVIDALIRQFVPAPIVEELDSATGLSYFAEIREVVTMFMKWDSYDSTDRHRDLVELQPCFFQAQRILHASGAYLRQFLVDDKGCVLIACWGMPHLTFLDNAHRAVGAAAQIQAALLQKRMLTSVGITCADVYCGTVGSMERMEYAAIGSEVNMAARLMGKAKGRLLVGQTCYDRLPRGDTQHLDAIEPMLVKGKSEPLQAYCWGAVLSPTLRRDASTAVLDIAPACRAPLLALLSSIATLAGSQESPSPGRMPMSPGRSSPSPGLKSPYFFASPDKSDRSHRVSGRTAFQGASMMSFRSPFALRTTRNPAPIVLINGKRGTGKSCVAAWLRAHAAEREVFTVGARMTKQTSSKPFFLWKKVFHQLSARADFRSNDGQWSHVNELFHEVFPNLSRLAEHVSLAALTEALGVGTTFSDKMGHPGGYIDLSEAGGRDHRRAGLLNRKPSSLNEAENLIDALVKIFAHLLGQQPSLLIVENVHLADEQSLGLLSKLVQRISHPNAVVLTALVPDEKTGNGNVVAKSQSLTSLLEAGGLSEKMDLAGNSPWWKKFQDAILKRKGTTVLTLSSYTRSDIDAMLSEALGTDTVPAEISQLVQDFSGGSYFWVREILQFIKEHGAEQFLSAIGETAPAAGSDHSPARPAPLVRRSSIVLAPALQRDAVLARQILAPTFQSAKSHRIVATSHQAQLDKLVLVRFGGLTPEAQRVLRTASIVGVTFTADVLDAVLPAHLQSEVAECLHTLVLQLWLYEDPDNDQRYIFAHPHTQQIIYELTPASERNLLYAQIAAYVEEKHGTDPAYFTALSHYYLHCDTDKALQYVIRAQPTQLDASTVYDFTDAVSLLSSSLAACKTIYDVDVLVKAAAECKRSIERFRLYPDTSTNAAEGAGWTRYFSCLRRAGDKVAPAHTRTPTSSASAPPGTATTSTTTFTKPRAHTEGTFSIFKKASTASTGRQDALSAEEEEARALFLKHLERLSTQLSTIYIELAEGAEGAEGSDSGGAKEWQLQYLGIRTSC